MSLSRRWVVSSKFSLWRRMAVVSRQLKSLWDPPVSSRPLSRYVSSNPPTARGVIEKNMCSWVNHAFRDTILASALQHKIDLYVAGPECNPATEIPLAYSRKTLQLHSNIDLLRPAEERMVDDPPPEVGSFTMTAGSV